MSAGEAAVSVALLDVQLCLHINVGTSSTGLPLSKDSISRPPADACLGGCRRPQTPTMMICQAGRAHRRFLFTNRQPRRRPIYPILTEEA